MKKIVSVIALILTVCVMMSVALIPAFATEATEATEAVDSNIQDDAKSNMLDDFLSSLPTLPSMPVINAPYVPAPTLPPLPVATVPTLATITNPDNEYHNYSFYRYLQQYKDSSGNVNFDEKGYFEVIDSCTISNFTISSEDCVMKIDKNATIKVTESLNNKGTIYVFGELDLSECKSIEGLDRIFYTYDRVIEPPSGFTLSQGNLTVIVGIVGVAVGFLVAMFIFKKKKNPIFAEEPEETE